MSLKDELNNVKAELSSDEKILESAFKLERIYKKNKIAIWSVLIILLLAVAGNAGYSVWKESKLQAANSALLALEENPDDTAAQKRLESKNPKLYNLWLYNQAIEKKDLSTLEKLSKNGDSILKDVAAYHHAVLQKKSKDSKYYHDLAMVEKAYLALKAGKKKEAKEILSLIPETAPVAPVARLLKHYTVK